MLFGFVGIPVGRDHHFPWSNQFICFSRYSFLSTFSVVGVTIVVFQRVESTGVLGLVCCPQSQHSGSRGKEVCVQGSLAYIVSFRTARATQRSPASGKKKREKKSLMYLHYN